jgi:hypothetical protein
MLRARQRDALKYIQERGVTLDNIVSVVEEIIHEKVRLIERQIYDAQNGQKELEYKNGMNFEDNEHIPYSPRWLRA